MSLQEYWLITPKQLEKYVEVYKQKEVFRAKEIDAHNFNLGKYIAVAVNDPKKYPKKPFLAEAKEEKKVMTPEEMQRNARVSTIILGGKVN